MAAEEAADAPANAALPTTPKPTEATLAALQAELADARATQAMLEDQVRELSAKSRRYEFIREQLLKEHPSMLLSNLRLDNDSMQVTDTLAEFLDLDARQKDRVNALGADILQRTKNWEKANQTIIAQSDDSYTTELPPYGGNMQEDYREQLAAILPTEDAAVIDSLTKSFFKGLRSKRQLQVNIKEMPDGKLQLHQKISVLDENGNTSSSRSSGYTVNDNGSSPFPNTTRWSHLYRITEDSE